MTETPSFANLSGVSFAHFAILSLFILPVVVLAAGSSSAEEDSQVASKVDSKFAKKVPTIALEALERGQKGYGLSVFAGTEPERFEVEVLGLVRKTTPELSYLLTRLSAQDLERSGMPSTCLSPASPRSCQVASQT